MPESVENPAPEHPLVEIDVLQANLVEAWSPDYDFFRILVVHRGEPNDRQCREAEVEQDVEETVVNLGAGEQRNRAKHEDRHRLQNVLVEHVADSVRISAVGLSPMEKEKVAEELELRNSVI